jgi:hypothetical protein
LRRAVPFWLDWARGLQSAEPIRELATTLSDEQVPPPEVPTGAELYFRDEHGRPT